jgi:hypothetical protein
MYWRAASQEENALWVAIYWKKLLRAANYKKSPKNELKLIDNLASF